MLVITGATGHIGNVLARQLVSQGEKVRVLALPGETLVPIEDIDVDIVYGDVTKPDTLRKAFQGAETVYHLAGIIRIAPGQKDLLYKVNVEGVKNVIAACHACQVKRLVYTSSVHAFVEPPKGEAINENTPIDPEKVKGDYAKSKAIATLELLKATRENEVEVIIVAPSGVIGPCDFFVSEMGQVILDYINKKLKAYIDGAYDFVDVRDVVTGIIAAATRGKPGEIYMLSGELIRVSQILKHLQKITNIKAPQYRMPGWVAIAVSPFSNLYYWILRQRPLFTKYSVQVLFSNANIDNSKARRELSFDPRPWQESITDACHWFENNSAILAKINKK
ncbi:SDR family oxidoreductase [Patescibacteria group bacterium]